MLTPFQRVDDDPTVACRKHCLTNSLSNIASLTRQHDAPRCRRTSDSVHNLKRERERERETRGSTRLVTWTKNGPSGFERQPKSAFKSVRTYQSPVSDSQQVLVECPFCGQRVPGDEALRSINKNVAGNEKRRGTKKNTTKRGARTDMDGGVDMRSLPCPVRAQRCVEETLDESLCTHFRHEHHPVPEPSNVFERNEQERSKGRHRTTRRAPRTRHNWSR